MEKKLLTLLLSIVVALSLASFSAADVHAQVGTIYSKYTTSEPDLDGTIHASEWADAICYENVGEDGKFTIYLMHGDDFFYIGLKIKDSTHNVDDWISITFDEGDDGGHGSGSGDGVLTDKQEDWKGITGDGDLIDGYWDTKGTLSEFWYPGFGVSVDFEAAIDYHVNRWEVEFKIPFQGNDGDPKDPSDLNIAVDDAPRMEIDLRDIPAGFIVYPEDSDYKDPSTYVELKFDNEPPTISGVSYAPTTPTPDDEVMVFASVTDDVSGLKSVTLLYSIDGGATWSSVTMTKFVSIETGEEKYKAEIPRQASGTTVQFKVSAEDNVFFSAESAVASYTVKTLIFGMEPILFYGLIIGLVVAILIVVVVIVLTRRPRPPAAPPTPPAPPVAPAVAYCPHCGAPVKPGDVYCPKCGQKLK